MWWGNPNQGIALASVLFVYSSSLTILVYDLTGCGHVAKLGVASAGIKYARCVIVSWTLLLLPSST